MPDFQTQADRELLERVRNGAASTDEIVDWINRPLTRQAASSRVAFAPPKIDPREVYARRQPQPTGNTARSVAPGGQGAPRLAIARSRSFGVLASGHYGARGAELIPTTFRGSR